MSGQQIYQDRSLYRKSLGSTGFVSQAGVSELFIIADSAWEPLARQTHAQVFQLIERWLAEHPEFGGLVPVSDDAAAPGLIREMIRMSARAEVGPMAAVAGAVAQAVGRALVKAGALGSGAGAGFGGAAGVTVGASALAAETGTGAGFVGAARVIIENGGDLYLNTPEPLTLAVFAGASPLSMRVGLVVPAGEWGCATSSGTVGPSLSFGRADAAVVLAADALLADACATRLGNEIHTAADLPRALELISHVPGVSGAVAIVGDQIGAVGAIQLTRL